MRTLTSIMTARRPVWRSVVFWILEPKRAEYRRYLRVSLGRWKEGSTDGREVNDDVSDVVVGYILLTPVLMTTNAPSSPRTTLRT